MLMVDPCYRLRLDQLFQYRRRRIDILRATPFLNSSNPRCWVPRPTSHSTARAPTTSRPSKMSAPAERRNPDLAILVNTPSASSSGPRSPATSLLDLPVEIISEISSYLMHRLDDSNHYFLFQDDSCHQSVTDRYPHPV